MMDANKVSDFNLHWLSQFSSRAFMVAGRFYDLAPEKFSWYSCEWYARHGFKELPNDRYVGQLPSGQDAIRFHSVDALVLENPAKLSEVGQNLYDNWLGVEKRLAETRKVPDTVILPPPLEPPMWEPQPKPKPVELPPKKEEPVKKNPNPNVVRFSVYFGMIAAVAGVVSWFIPGAKPWVAAIVPIIKAILSLFGA